MKPFTVDDLFEHKKITDLHGLAGNSAAYGTVRSVHREDNKYTSQVWRFDASGEPAQPALIGDGTDNSPRLSPDGKTLAFLSNRGATAPQLFLLPLTGGEARQLGEFEKGASSLRWAPDSRSLYVGVALAVTPDNGGKRGPAPPTQDDTDAEVCWKLPYKMDGMGYLLGREIHVFSIEVDSGEKKQLTDGPFEVLGFETSRDGKQLAYTRTREGRFAHLKDLWVCDSSGGQHSRVTNTFATVMQPSWSPNGNFIAFAGALKEGDSEARLWVLDMQSGKARCLGGDTIEVAHPESLHWDENNKRIFVSRAWRGRHEVVAVSVETGDIEVLVSGDRQLGVFAPLEDGFAFTPQSPAIAEELFYTKASGSEEIQISSFNTWWKSRTPIDVSSLTFDVPDGQGGTEQIQGWLLRAQDAPKDEPLPLLNDIHGGPASYALLDFDTNVYWQALCSRGWAVLLLNAVGSSSFGGEFCSRLSGNWGELDLPQHLAAIQQLQAQKLCDDRVCVTGKSYGGFLSSWAIGHTDLFKAAVVMAPVGNIETHYGTSDGGYYADPLYIGTAPQFDREKSRELSPLQSIEKATTPTIFLQGKDDERCPKCQSEELFVSLYRAGDTHTELVLYPGEGHLFLGEGKPRCRADAAQRIIDWHVSHTA